MARWLSLAAVLCLLPIAARANGRYPSAGQVAVDPGDPTHLVLRTTFGFLQTHDAGHTWTWMCESAIGYEGQEDPFIGIVDGGNIAAATTQGLSVSSVGGCAWDKVTAPAYVGQSPATDLVVDPLDPKRIVALVVAADQAHHRLVVSEDRGATWTELGQPLPDGVVGLTLELTRDTPQRIYVSALLGADLTSHGLLLTDDGGAHWTTHPFTPKTTDAQGVPLPVDQTVVLGTYIGAIDPGARDTVWLRVRRVMQGDQLWRTQDAGLTWTLAFEAVSGRLPAFALSPDGASVAVGAGLPKPGLWRAATADLAFAKVRETSTSCLKWVAAGLYLCADEDSAGWTLAQSGDGGDSVTPLFHRADLTPLACPTASRTAVICGKLWPGVADQLGVGQSPASPAPAPSSCAAARPSAGVTASALVALALAGGVWGLARWRARRAR